MKEPRIDDERMSALLDGTLQGARRDELLKELAASDDDYDVFAETAAVLREMEDDEEGVVSLEKHRAKERRDLSTWIKWGAAAAVLAALALVPVVASRRGAAADPVRLAALVDAREGRPEGWERWTPNRGEPAVAAQARAAQAGAHLVDLAVAVEARDSADVWLLARQAQVRFDSQSGSAGPFQQIAARAGAPAESLRPLVQSATERLAERLGEEDHLRLGAWAEAARLATARRNEAFFRDKVSRTALTRADQTTRGDSAAQAALTRVRAAIPEEGPPDWSTLGRELRAFLDALAT